MPSPDCSTAVRGAQGWILTAKSSITATKITAFVRSSTKDLRLGHKIYHRVDFQSIYTTSSESSSSDLPCAATRWSKIRQFVTRASHAFSIAPIISRPPSSESSFFNLHHRKRIAFIRLTTHSHAPLKYFACCLRATRATILLLLTSSVTLLCHVNPRWRHHPGCCWRHRPVSLLTSSIDFDLVWPLTF